MYLAPDSLNQLSPHSSPDPDWIWFSFVSYRIGDRLRIETEVLRQAHELHADVPHAGGFVVAGAFGEFLDEGFAACLLAVAPAPVGSGLAELAIGNDLGDAIAREFLGDVALGDVLLEPGEDFLEQFRGVAK
jgi:hypothetical protein